MFLPRKSLVCLGFFLVAFATLHAQPSRGVAKPESLGVAYPSTLWPKVNGIATVYYTIDSASDPNATAKINTAISTFNADFAGVIQWVAWTASNGPNYVDINLNADDQSGQCEANEGYEATPAQPMTGSTACTVTTILHEMGHVIGLWHEQSRADRNSYITLNYANVIKGSWGNYAVQTDNQQILSPYDYASVMQYPAYSFSRNGGPVIETIPAGMPLGSVDGVPVTTADYSAGDKETIERLYGAAPTKVTVTSNPIGLQVLVDGTAVTTPQTYSWALNSTHTLSVATGLQTLTGDIANSTTSATFYYTYGRWNNTSSQTQTITVTPGSGSSTYPTTSPQIATYSANFIQLVPYTASVYPSGSGAVQVSPAPQSYSGVSGSFFTARQQATLTASPATGWSFYEFNNAPFWLPGGLGANPKTFYVPDTGNPVATTAEFSNTPVFTIDVTPDAFSSNLYAYIDGSFFYTPKNFSSYYDSSWTFGSSHTVSVDSPIYPYSVNSRYAFSSWSDGGAQTHTLAALPGSSKSYIATLTPQFAPATNFNYPPCGGTGTLSPNSPTGDGFYPSGQSLSFAATPDSGWDFAGWSYDLSGTSTPASLTATDETLVFANFNTTTTPLTLTGISPANGTAGGAAFTLTLSGTGFTPETLVSANGQYRTVTYQSPTSLQVPITAADIASPGAFQVFVENFPSGWNGCAVFGYQTFLVNGSGGSTTPAATPTFSPAAGTYSSAQSVTLSDSTSGAMIYYTTDGSTPSTASTRYTVPLSVTSTETLKAIATANNYAPSAVGSATYTINLPAVTLSPTSIAFGSAKVGTQTNVSIATLTNSGTGALSIASITMTGPNAGQFATSNNCGTSVAAGAQCSIRVRFAPTAVGADSAAITITDNAAGSPQSISLTGTGTGPVAVTLSPTSIAFGNEKVGSQTNVSIATLTNTGTGPLSITSIAMTGPNAGQFATSNNCGTSVAAGAQCSIRVRFAPTTVGADSAAITITDNAAGSPQSIPLSGTGTGPAAVTLSATSVAFGNEKAGTQTNVSIVTLTNSGTGPLSITSIAMAGTNAGEFDTSNNCGTSVAAGAQCSIRIRFAPNAVGAASAAITITDNAAGSPQSIALSGTGT